MPWLCIALGVWAVALRPWDRQAWLLLVLMVSFPHLSNPPHTHWPDGFRTFAILYHGACYMLLPVSMVLFGVYFAERLSLDRRFPWAKYLLIIPAIVSGAANVTVTYLRSENFLLAPGLLRTLPTFSQWMSIVHFVSIGVFFACLGMKTGMSQNPDARRRLKLLLIGTQIAMGPTFLLILFTGFTGLNSPSWLVTACLLMVFLFPLTFFYVIVVHRALGVGVVVRQGIQYALARGGARILFLALGVAVLFYSINTALDPDVKRPNKFAVIALGVTGLFVLQRLRLRIADTIDRHFFRQAYDAERILLELSEDVRTIVDSQSLLKTVGGKISETLFVPRVVVFLEEGQSYRPAYSLGYERRPDVSFSDGAATVQQLREAREPARVYLDDKNSWLYRTPDMTEEERRKLETLESQLILPLAVKEKLLGFISLGQKRSEEPYSGSDLRLLRSLAVQTGLALENSRLTAVVAQEAAQREKLNRELEIAREVQERLFPQQIPVIEGLDLAGGCRPALEVGGDYYDFLQLSDGNLGVVIGDVAGKGIAAALLMASLQASVRSQIVVPGESLAGIIARVNTLIYECSTSSRYATLFYGQLNLKTMELNYVNAGQNPPLLLRATGEVEQLQVGGTVVGLLPRFPYQQGKVEMRRGDMLLGFTDGVSEAQNYSHDEWGEDRLIATIRHAGPVAAAELIPIILDAADEFVAGAPQHDDMTMVIVKLV